MLERNFQAKLVKDIKRIFPGCIVFKNDTETNQGFPDLTILYEDKWAVLEDKANKEASHRPNQDYYIDILNNMSFARFVFPENKDEVLEELVQFFTGT